MHLAGVLPTDGFIACGMVKSNNGKLITIASSGGGGHIYRLDTTTDTLSDLGVLGGADWHSLDLSENEKVGFGSSLASDELVFVNLEGTTASVLTTLALNPTPGIANDQPDNIAVQGNTVFASLRASGKLAIIQADQLRVSYIDLSPPAPFSPANCAGWPCTASPLGLKGRVQGSGLGA